MAADAPGAAPAAPSQRATTWSLLVGGLISAGLLAAIGWHRDDQTAWDEDPREGQIPARVVGLHRNHIVDLMTAEGELLGRPSRDCHATRPEQGLPKGVRGRHRKPRHEPAAPRDWDSG